MMRRACILIATPVLAVELTADQRSAALMPSSSSWQPREDCVAPDSWEGSNGCPGRRRRKHTAAAKQANDPVMWHLPTLGTREYRLSSAASGGSCNLTYARRTGEPLGWSGMLFGECPHVMQNASAPTLIDYTRRSGKHGVGHRGECSYRGSNPSVLALPPESSLRMRVPAARYLISINSLPLHTWVGEYCPNSTAYTVDAAAFEADTCPAEPTTVIGLYDDAFRPILVTPLRREGAKAYADAKRATVAAAGERNAARGGATVGRDGHPILPVGEALEPSSPYVSISTLADVSLGHANGRFFLSGQDYFQKSKRIGVSVLRLRPLVSPLRVEVVFREGCAPRLYVAHQDTQERIVGACSAAKCAEADLSPHAFQDRHKNPTLFVDDQGVLQNLDWAIPPRVGPITTLPRGRQDAAEPSNFWSLPNGVETRQCQSAWNAPYTDAGSLCFEPHAKYAGTAAYHAGIDNIFASLAAEAGGWQQLVGEPPIAGAQMVHNGHSLVRVPHLPGAMLGIAHVAFGSGIGHGLPPLNYGLGGKGDDVPVNSNHYLHFWFTVNDKPPYKALALSPLFCLPSARDQHDCESVQFASSLSASSDGETLVVGYGVADANAYATKVPSADVARMLRRVLDSEEPGKACVYPLCR